MLQTHTLTPCTSDGIPFVELRHSLASQIYAILPFVNPQSAGEPASRFAEMTLEHLLMQENPERKRHPDNRDSVGNYLRRSICSWSEDHAVTVVKAAVSLLILVAGLLLYVISVILLISVAHIWWLHLRTF